MVVRVVSQFRPPLLLVETEEVARMVWLVHRELTIPPQPLNLIFEVVVVVRVAGLRDLAQEWAGRVVLEGRMVAVAGVAERVDTQQLLVLVVSVVRVAKVRLKFFFIDKQAQTKH
jgi:hypothetical protein